MSHGNFQNDTLSEKCYGKSADLTTSIRHLKNIMKAFEKSLMNNWNRHHLRFIAFAENGTSDDWHFHILFNQGKFTEQKLQNAVLAATN